MLMTAATLFSSPCHSHPFVLLHFAFLLGTADSGKMVWVTCGILVLLALIYSQPHSCTFPEPALLGIPTARAHVHPRSSPAGGIGTLSCVAGCLLLPAPGKKSCFLPPLCIWMPRCLNQITSLHSRQSLYPLKPSLNVTDNTVFTINISLFHDRNFYLLIEILIFLASVSSFKEQLNEIVLEDTHRIAQNRDFFFQGSKIYHFQNEFTINHLTGT